MLQRQIPIYYVYITALALSLASYFMLKEFNLKAGNTSLNNSAPVEQNSCTYKISRLGGFNYVAPLLYAEPECESAELDNTKQAIEKVIISNKVSGTINSASVYLRSFTKGEWTEIEGGNKYSPGSLLKVPELITFFKMNETHPGLLDKKILYDKPMRSNKSPLFLSKSIELGKSYSIRELLYYMIAYSDNNATMLLNQQIDIPTFKKVFTDLGLPSPDWNSSDYRISAKDYSVFMKVLYNTAYLNIKDSEYCMELLSHCDFKEGLLAGIPKSCKVAHKFGEGGTTDSPQLSESGIVFCNNSAYLITIMVNGKDMNKLPGVISCISNTAYEQMSHYLASGI